MAYLNTSSNNIRLNFAYLLRAAETDSPERSTRPESIDPELWETLKPIIIGLLQVLDRPLYGSCNELPIPTRVAAIREKSLAKAWKARRGSGAENPIKQLVALMQKLIEKGNL